MSAWRRGMQVVAVIVLVSVVCPRAAADFISISNPPGSELSHASILEGIYSPGSSWTGFGRMDGSGHYVDFTNGTLTALRVDDFGRGGVLNVNLGAAGLTDDQRWTGGPLTATARARYAAYSQRFGYDLEGDGAGYCNLFDVCGSGLSVTGSGVLVFSVQDVWSWGRAGTGQTWLSDPAQNADQRDHLVTYQVNGLGDGYNHWLLFWEDLNNLGDKDYNDLVVEITAPVPEPAAGLLALFPAAMIRRPRRMA